MFTIVIILLIMGNGKGAIVINEPITTKSSWITTTQKSVAEFLSPCLKRNAWFHCPSQSMCISSSQLCDGRIDCWIDGGDENPEMCKKWKCQQGVRCRTSPLCIHVPHRHVCNKAQPMCPDGSDQAYCMHKIYTGCFVSTKLGLRLSHCRDCFCDLRNPSSPDSAFVYRSKSKSHRSSLVAGRVCLSKNSPRICDGISDCINGEDESKCGNTTTTDFAVVVVSDGLNRRGRSMGLDDDKKGDLLFTFFKGDFLAAFLVSLVFFALFVFGFTAIVVYLCNANKKCHLEKTRTEKQLHRLSTASSTESEYSISSLSTSTTNDNVYVSQRSLELEPVDEKWNWNLSTLIREIGSGFYGRVFLVKDHRGRPLAVKTVEKDREKYNNVFENEINILNKLGNHHENIVKLIGYNRELEVIIFEYCHHGNLRSFIRSNRDKFIDEIDPKTKDLREDKVVYRSPTIPIEMSDFLTSLQTKLDESDTLKRRRGSDSMLMNTRRLLKWSKQIAKGMAYLHSKSILHGDLALRNILLSRSDVIKISDFGLSSCTSDPRSFEEDFQEALRKPLPVAWLPPESFTNSNFLAGKTLDPDVWAFGVTLWEIFTLGAEPYGDIDLDDLGDYLLQGNRLSLPDRAPKILQTIMTSCWHAEIKLRPDFDSIRFYNEGINDDDDDDILHSYYSTELLCQRRLCSDVLPWSNPDSRNSSTK